MTYLQHWLELQTFNSYIEYWTNYDTSINSYFIIEYYTARLRIIYIFVIGNKYIGKITTKACSAAASTCTKAYQMGINPQL